MEDVEVYRREQHGYRTQATYDEFVLCVGTDRDYRHIDVLSVWNEDSEVMLATFWIVGDGRSRPIHQIQCDDKAEPHSEAVDFVLKPRDELRVRFYDGSDGDEVYGWAYGTVGRVIAGEGR